METLGSASTTSRTTIVMHGLMELPSSSPAGQMTSPAIREHSGSSARAKTASRCDRNSSISGMTLTVMTSSGWEINELSCYLVVEDVASWTDAKGNCTDLGGVLASITSEDEQAFVSGLLNSSAWIGLSDQETEGEFTWEDGSPFNYDSWEEGEPNNSYMYLTLGVGEDCVEMKKEYDFRWNDELCPAERA
ncbi:mannose receptor [Penaeus vannamei]|uniref:Mannose receptor n=1 Tax=Penaeus vannamei TaxID=6689 RepID=A0A423SHZ6_PENVA|nr:mannose receptor [Penaeus vannamei]